MSNSPAATRSGEEPLAPMELNIDQEAFAYSTAPVTVGTLSATPDRENRGSPQIVDPDSPQSVYKDLSPPPSSLPSTDSKTLQDNPSGPNISAIGRTSLMMEENSHLTSHQQHSHHASHTKHNSNNFFANLQSESFPTPSSIGLVSQVHVQHHQSPLHKHAENLSSQFSKPQTVSSSHVPRRRVATDSPSLSPPPPQSHLQPPAPGPPAAIQSRSNSSNNFFDSPSLSPPPPQSHLQPPAIQSQSSSSNNFFERQRSSGDDGSSVFSLRKSVSPENSYSSLPSRLNEAQSSTSPRPPIHTLASRKTVSPAVNVLPSPNTPYDIAQDNQLLSSHSSPYAPVQYDMMHLSSTNPPLLSSHTHRLQYPGPPQVSSESFNPPPMVPQMNPQQQHMYHQTLQKPEEYLVRRVQTDQFRPHQQARPHTVQEVPYHQPIYHGSPMMQHVRPEMVEMRPQLGNEPLQQSQYYSLPHNAGNYPPHNAGNYPPHNAGNYPPHNAGNYPPLPIHPVPLASHSEMPPTSNPVSTSDRPQLTGYTEVSHPIAYTESPVPVSIHQGQYPSPVEFSVTQVTDDDKSTSSFYSAEDGPTSLPKTPKDPWVPLIQKYMQLLEKKSTSLASTRDKSPNRSSDTNGKTLVSPRNSRHAKQKKDDQSLLQKELDKAYERISSLEIRVQDLTAQVTSDIPEDRDLSLLSRQKLEQDFKKMRELKKKAEMQSMEAKQTAQRLITENFRLKEELAQLKNEYDMLLVELRRMRRKTTEREQWRDEKVEAMRKSLREAVEMNFKDFELTGGRGALMAEVSDYPTEDFSLELFWKIIKEEEADLTVGQVAFMGLPSAGKTTLLKSLLEKELGGEIPEPRKGAPTCIEFYELMANINPLTGDSKWKNIPGIDSAAEFLARVTAKYYYRQKRSPSFATDSIAASLSKLFPSTSEVAVKNTLEKLFNKVKALLEEEKKEDSMTQLALFKPLYMNIWDVGTNRALFSQLLPVVAGHSKQLVILNVIDLERDVPTATVEPPRMSYEIYQKRGDDKIFMQLYSKFEYFMLMAGLKKWFNPDDAPTDEQYHVTLVGTYTKQFLTEKGEEGVKALVDSLKKQVLLWAAQFSISSIINPIILTFCIDGDKALKDRELSAVKESIQSLVKAHAKDAAILKSFPAKWIFLRSILYNPTSLSISFKRLSVLARSCGIYTDDSLKECLLVFRNVGSIIFNPEMDPRTEQLLIIIDVPCMIKFLDRLFYIEHYHSTGVLSLSTEEKQYLNYYRHGLVTTNIAEKLFTKSEYQTVLWCLSFCKVAVQVEVNKKQLYFMPSLRNKANTSSPRQLSLYVQFDRHYFQSDQLVLFHDKLTKAFPLPDSVEIDPCDEFNMTRFKYKSGSDSNSSLIIEIIYHKSVIEVRVLASDSHDEEQGLLNISLCTKILNLCKLVYDDVCKNVQIGLKYHFCLFCPRNNPDSVSPHYVKFKPGESKSLHCNECEADVKELIKDDRLLWINAEINKNI